MPIYIHPAITAQYPSRASDISKLDSSQTPSSLEHHQSLELVYSSHSPLNLYTKTSQFLDRRSSVILPVRMSATFESTNNEQMFYDMLEDPRLDDLLAHWSNEPSTLGNMNEQLIDPALLQQDNAQNNLFLSPFSSPQAIVGAQDLGLEQRYVSYPETPSLTTCGWAPPNSFEGQCQYDANPSLFGGLIDPQLDSVGLLDWNPHLDIPALPSQVMDTASVLQTLSGTHSDSTSLSRSSSRKRKQAPTSLEQDVHTKRTCYPSRTPKPRPSNPNAPAPLSIRTAGSRIPLKDMRAQIMRPAERRQKEAEFGRNAKKQAVPRPMNSFMLYRAAYTERIQALNREGENRNHQIVSSVAGESWRMETEEVKREFAELAELDKRMHKIAFPGYKYLPVLK